MTDRWHSVAEEGLPTADHCGPYLVYCRVDGGEPEVTPAYFFNAKIRDHAGFSTMLEDARLTDVTHWMLFPDGPEENT